MNESCQVDLMVEWKVVQYIRDLLNLADLLEKGFDAELLKFTEQLKVAGWGKKQIQDFVTRACYGTRFEQSLPHPIPNAGSWKEWLKIKSIHK